MRNGLDKEIVKMLSEGQKVAKIGAEVKLSPRTVETYIEEIKKKHGALNIPHLVAIWLRNELIT